MPFQEAVRSVLTQYANFTGRARRSEFWWWVLAYFVAAVVANILDSIIGTQIFIYLLVLAVIVPSLAVGARRLHDTDKSGWWQLLSLNPVIGTIVLIVFWVGESEPDNSYGASPKPGTVPGV